MKAINDEIKLTLSLMHADAYEGANNELQYHLVCLLEIKRDRLVAETGLQSELERIVAALGIAESVIAQCRKEPVMNDQAPYKSWQFGDPDKPLTVDELIACGVLVKGGDRAKPMTVEELRAGGWWCGDTSEACRLALESFGFKFLCCIWDSDFDACFVDNLESDAIGRGSEFHATSTLKLKQIYRYGNEFYWSEK